MELENCSWGVIEMGIWAETLAARARRGRTVDFILDVFLGIGLGFGNSG